MERGEFILYSGSGDFNFFLGNGYQRNFYLAHESPAMSKFLEEGVIQSDVQFIP